MAAAQKSGALELGFMTDPGGDRGESKDTPMKLRRHARPDAGASSSAAPLADFSTREHLRAAPNGDPRTACATSPVCPPWHGSSRH
jgi:hypothetical protein